MEKRLSNSSLWQKVLLYLNNKHEISAIPQISATFRFQVRCLNEGGAYLKVDLKGEALNRGWCLFKGTFIQGWCLTEDLRYAKVPTPTMQTNFLDTITFSLFFQSETTCLSWYYSHIVSSYQLCSQLAWQKHNQDYSNI